MFNFKEYHDESKKIYDRIVWAAMIAPGTLLNKDGSYQKTFRYRGHDLNSSTEPEVLALASQLNNVLRRLGSGWAMYSEACRKVSTYYPTKQFPDKITQMMDGQRRQYFSEGRHFVSTYYVTLQYLPPEDKIDKLKNKLFIKQEEAEASEHARVQEHLGNFLTEFNRVFNLFRDLMKECEVLTSDETLTYLHDCVSVKRHPVITPDIPMYLDVLLCDSPLLGGTNPELGNTRNKEYLGVVSVINFPAKVNPGILDELNQLNIEYRWVTRFIALDKSGAQGLIQKLRRQWFSSRKSMGTLIKEMLTRSESAMTENTAYSRYQDAQQALEEIDDDVSSLGYYTTEVVIRNADAKVLETQLREIERVINSRGFTSKTEDYNAVGAWMGSLPGMSCANVREPLMTSLGLAFMFPLSAIWAGQETNKHLNAPALMQVNTAGSTPFHFNLHYNDFGNAMIIGPIGSGKSVLLNTLEMHCRGYENAKVYIFDKGGSCRAATAGVSGIFYDLADETSGIAFQPLRYIDEENERIWANEWLQMIYAQEGVQLSPDDKQEIWAALELLSKSNISMRTMSAFYVLLQNMELKKALAPFVDSVDKVVDKGPYGALFGANEDFISDNSWQAFEMGELMHKTAAVLPTLQYLFHVIEKRCKGEPTFIFLDECWVFLDNPIFAAKIREWFKTMRKNNVSIIFATQSLSDVADSKIAPAIMESCVTRIFLPNPTAMTPNSKEIYERFSLNKTERGIIATAVPKRQYYFKSILGCRLFELALSDFLLAYVASASKEDQAEVMRIQREYPDDDFNLHWLEYKKQYDALEFYKRM